MHDRLPIRIDLLVCGFEAVDNLILTRSVLSHKRAYRSDFGFNIPSVTFASRDAGSCSILHVKKCASNPGFR